MLNLTKFGSQNYCPSEKLGSFYSVFSIEYLDVSLCYVYHASYYRRGPERMWTGKKTDGDDGEKCHGVSDFVAFSPILLLSPVFSLTVCLFVLKVRMHIHISLNLSKMQVL